MRLLSALVLLAVAASAGAEDYRLLGDFQYSSDSDDLSQRSYAAGYQHALHGQGLGAYWAARAGRRDLDAPAGSEHFDSLQLDWRTRTDAPAGALLRLNPLFGDRWSPTLGSAQAHWKPGERWYLEGSFEREFVDTLAAVRNRVRIDTSAVSADWSPLPWFTAVIAGNYSNFSDGNDRIGRTARLIMTPSSGFGLRLQLRLKRNDSDHVGLGYFNPRRLEEYEFMAGIGGSPWSERWNLSLQAGTGQQFIDRGDGHSIYSVDARARGWFSDHYGLETRAVCNNTGSLTAQSADNYHYCQGTLTLIGTW